VICGTPRSGSTLLCEMLWASRVAGRPNSFFRQQSVAHWKELWGLGEAVIDSAYIAAMLDYGRAGTPIFGLRLMWGSLGDAVRVLGSGASFPELADRVFGETLFIHLSRNDKVAQAVSLLRAERSGLWHLNADGSVLEGEATPASVQYDGARIAAILAELEADDANWNAFFAREGLTPLRLTYETVTADPQAALATVLGALGQAPAIAATVPTPTAKIGGATSRAWADRFRAENGLTDSPR
jgi:LPS sulfotransferase NodH